MMKQVSLFLLLLLAMQVKAQNMVPNGNFEQYATCPTDGDQVYKCTGWQRYHDGSSDYFNVCGTANAGIPFNAFGTQAAVSGEGYMGVYAGRKPDNTDYKEYITRGIDSLKKDVPYEVSMSVSLAEVSQYGTNGLGIWFYYKNPGYTGTSGLPVTPQVMYPDVVTNKAGWTRLSKIFIPDSTYKNIVIGGFIPSPTMTTIKADSGTTDWCYYYIDSIVVKRVSRIAMSLTRNAFCAGDTITVPFALYGISYFQSGNIFSLQLSDPSGSFANFTTLATIAGSSDDTFRYIVPSTIISGANYRIRIASDKNADTSSASDAIAIGNLIPDKPDAGSNSPVCTGNTLYFTVTSKTPGVQYIWSGPRGFADTLQYPFINLATQSDSGAYIVTAWLYGCSSSDTIHADVTHVIGVANSSVNDPVCENDSLKLSAHVVGQAVSYSWTGPSGFQSTAKDTIIVHPSTALSGFYIFSANFKGCSSTDTLEVLVKAPPAIPYAGDDKSICDGDTLKLTGNAATQGVTYNWTVPNGTIAAGQTYKLTSAATSATGAYICTANLSGCTNSDTVNVIVKPRPQVPDVNSNSPLKLGETLKMTINNPEQGVYYNWVGPDQFSSVLLDPSIRNVNKINQGIYYIGAALNGCYSGNLLFVTVDGAIDPALLVVFPNASNGDFTIRAAVATDQEVYISINNSNGQLIYEAKTQTTNQLLNLHLSLKDMLASGLYTLRARIDGKVRSVNLIIDRNK